MKKITVLAVIFILTNISLLFCGCTSNSETTDLSNFLSKWTSDDNNAPFVFGNQVTFNEDGTLTYASEEYGATYKIKGKNIEYVTSDTNAKHTVSFSFSENFTKLTLTDSSWDKTAIYEKKGTTGGSLTTQEKEFEEIHGSNNNNDLNDFFSK